MIGDRETETDYRKPISYGIRRERIWPTIAEALERPPHRRHSLIEHRTSRK